MKKFIIKSKETVSITISVQPHVYKKLHTLSEKSNRSKNELVNAALRFAFDRLEFRQE